MPAASAPSTCSVFGTLRTPDGNPAAGTAVTFELLASGNPLIAGDNLVVINNLTVTCDATGFFSAVLTRSSQLAILHGSGSPVKYQVECPPVHLNATILVPDLASADILTLV